MLEGGGTGLRQSSLASPLDGGPGFLRSMPTKLAEGAQAGRSRFRVIPALELARLLKELAE
jgi:hypothetical protein